MHIPPKSTNRFKVIQAVYLYGPMTAGDAGNRFPSIGAVAVSNAMRGCAKIGLLRIDEAHSYHLTEFTQKYFDGCESDREISKPEIVPPRQAPQFRPISTKYIPSVHARRDDAGPARDISFKTGGIGFMPFRLAFN